MMTDNVLLLDEQKTTSIESLRWNYAPAELLGRSAAAEQLRNMVRKLAPTDATVLIRGESGTGKEFIARLIAQESPRCDAPFLHIDCAAIPAGQLEALLFGQQGRLPGHDQEGALTMAHSGTVLLEEIGVLPLALQGKLLAFLQNQLLSEQSNVRLLATTNRSLEASVERGEFREDLLNALGIVPIAVAPLRERREDIPVLAEHFRKVYARKHGLEVLAISSACQQALVNYAWPGNIRELETLIERAVILCKSGVLELKHLASGPSGDSAQGEPEAEELAVAEKKHIFMILRRCQNNRTHAAKRLGISIRTLRNKLREYRQEAQQTGEENPLLTATN